MHDCTVQTCLRKAHFSSIGAAKLKRSRPADVRLTVTARNELQSFGCYAVTESTELCELP